MSNNELIVVEQLPIIKEQLKLASAEIDKKVAEAMSVLCTEENVKVVKEIRASLNKEYKNFEEKRKEVKTIVLKPYEEFENVYEEHISNKFKKADLALKGQIEAIENELKEKKREEVKKYFNEYQSKKNIDFVTFENANINVTLTASMKSLKEQAKSFLDKIADDLALIETQEHKTEILVEYKQSLNVSNAITTVNNRIKAVEEEKAKQERDKELQDYILEVARESDKHVPTIEEVEQVTFEPKTEFKVVQTKKKVALILDVTDEELVETLAYLDTSKIKYELGGMLCTSIKQ